MKKILLLICTIIALLSFGLVNSVSDDNLHIHRVTVDNLENVDVNRDIITRVDLSNVGSVDLNDVKITVSIPELGLRRSVGPFSLDEDERELRRVILEMVDKVKPGEYYVKVEARSKDIRKTKYRPITIG